MQGDLSAFCHRQSTKMIEYAEGCTDPVLKDKLLRMSAYWLKLLTSPPSRVTQQSAFESTSVAL
jgi:hypothetical protein